METKAISGANPLVMKHWCCDETNVTDCDYCGALVVFPESRTEITTCSIDVVDFPFDYQNCVISLDFSNYQLKPFCGNSLRNEYQ